MWEETQGFCFSSVSSLYPWDQNPSASANTINLRIHQHTQPTHPPGEEQMSLRGTNGNSTVNPHGLTRTQNAFFLCFFLLRFDLQEDEEGLMYGDAPCLDIL